MATSRVAGARELAKKVRVWLGQRGKTLDDVAPASYALETTAVTSENYLIVLRAVYTVGPKQIDTGGGGDDKKSGEEPLLLHAKLVAPPSRVTITKGGGCPSRVKKLVRRHVRVLAAGMTTKQMFTKGAAGFVKEALDRVNLGLGKSGGPCGVVYSAAVERLAIHVPSNKVTVAVVAEEGAAPTTGFAMQIGAANVQVGVKVCVDPGREAAVAVAVVDPATKKADWDKQIKVAGVRAELQMELDGKKALSLKFNADRAAPS